MVGSRGILAELRLRRHLYQGNVSRGQRRRRHTHTLVRRVRARGYGVDGPWLHPGWGQLDRGGPRRIPEHISQLPALRILTARGGRGCSAQRLVPDHALDDLRSRKPPAETWPLAGPQALAWLTGGVFWLLWDFAWRAVIPWNAETYHPSPDENPPEGRITRPLVTFAGYAATAVASA